MTAVLPEDVAAIVQIGSARVPREACGLLLARSDGGPRLAEVPNVAEDATKDCRMTNAEVLAALKRLVGDPHHYPGPLERELVVWHTHPGGRVGPSKTDMQFRRTLGSIRCLVVSLPGGEAVQF